MPIFYICYIFKAPRARASFTLKMWSNFLFQIFFLLNNCVYIKVPWFVGFVFNYFVIIWGIAPTFCNFLKSKFKKKNLKNRLGLFSTDAIYSRPSGQEPLLLWRCVRIFTSNLFLVEYFYVSIKVPWLVWLLFIYFVIIWVSASTFFYYLKSKLKEY